MSWHAGEVLEGPSVARVDFRTTEPSLEKKNGRLVGEGSGASIAELIIYAVGF